MDLVRENARMLAGAAQLSGDDHIRREAADWIHATPEQRLAMTLALSGQAQHMLSQLSEDARARAEQPSPLSDDALAILARMRRPRHGPR